VNYFEIVSRKLDELGFFNYIFPFLLITALVYVLLKKSKLVESPVALGSISLAISFIVVFGFPLITGLKWGSFISSFMAQASVFLLIFFVGFLFSSFFYPNLVERLPEFFKRRTTLLALVGFAFVLFVTSGLVNVFTSLTKPGVQAKLGGKPFPASITMFLVAIFLLATFILLAGAISRWTE